MKITLVLRDKKNALKLSNKTIESFTERIKTDTKDGVVARRRKQFCMTDNLDGYDRQNPSHLIYPSAEFIKDSNDNLCMKTFNGIVAMTVNNLQRQADIEAVKQAAKILHYTQAAFIGPTGSEVIILVRIATPNGHSLTEEEADAYCQTGYNLASSLYQGILPKPISKESASVRTCFHMPLDPLPYYNAEAIALPVSEKPLPTIEPLPQVSVEMPLEDEDAASSDISLETKKLIDFLNARYQFRYNTIMGYTEYKDSSYRYMDWQPVDDRALKGLTMKVRLGGIDARDNDVRRYVQSNMIRPFNPIGDYLWEQSSSRSAQGRVGKRNSRRCNQHLQ